MVGAERLGSEVEVTFRISRDYIRCGEWSSCQLSLNCHFLHFLSTFLSVSFPQRPAKVKCLLCIKHEDLNSAHQYPCLGMAAHTCNPSARELGDRRTPGDHWFIKRFWVKRSKVESVV